MNHKRKDLSEMSFGSEDDVNMSQSYPRAVDMSATTNGSETEQQLSPNLALFRRNMQSGEDSMP